MNDTKLVNKKDFEIAQLITNALNREKNTINRHLKTDSQVEAFKDGLVAIASNLSKSSAGSQVSADSVVKTALNVAILGLNPHPIHSLVYFVPFKDSLQLIISSKGFVNLATKSGSVEVINTAKFQKHQLKITNKITLDYEVIDEPEKQGEPYEFYTAYVRLKNGFTHTEIWTKSQIEAHAKKYSPSYGRESSPWTQNFDGMATKTVLKAVFNKGFLDFDAKVKTAIQQDEAIHRSDGIIFENELKVEEEKEQKIQEVKKQTEGLNKNSSDFVAKKPLIEEFDKPKDFSNLLKREDI